MVQHSMQGDIQVLMTLTTSQRDMMSMTTRQNSSCMYLEDRLCKRISYQMQMQMQRTMSHHLKSELMLSEMSHKNQMNKTMYTEVIQKLLLCTVEVQDEKVKGSQRLITSDCRCEHN